MDQVGAVGDVDAAVAGLQSSRNEQSVGEDGDLVGLAGALAVFEDDDLVVGLLAGLDLRVGLAARQPEPAGGVPVHLDRLVQERIGGEEVDLKAVGDLERLAFDLGIGVGDLGVALGGERYQRGQEKQKQREGGAHQ